MNINATLLGQAITFAILIWFTMKFVWPPLTTALDERAKKIAEGLAAAERGKSEMELSAKRAAEELRTAREKAAEIISQGEKRRDELIDEAKTAAKAEGDRLLAGAKAEIEQEVSRAKESLRQRVAELSIAGAEKILKREINPQVHADLLTTLKNQL